MVNIDLLVVCSMPTTLYFVGPNVNITNQSLPISLRFCNGTVVHTAYKYGRNPPTVVNVEPLSFLTRYLLFKVLNVEGSYFNQQGLNVG